MRTKQLYYVLIGLLLTALGGFAAVGYGANALMSGQAAKLSDLRADSKALDDQQTALVKDKQDIKDYSELNTIAKAIVPQDKDQAAAVLQIVKIAADSGIPKISSITFPSSNLGVAAGATLKTNTKSADLTQLTPVKNISGVYQLQITVTQSSSDKVSYNQFITFLTKLEQNRRTAQVSSIQVEPDSAQPNMVSFTLVINEFIKP